MPKENELTVLLLSSSYPRYTADNSSIFLRYLANSLVREGARVYVLAPDHPTVDNTPLDKLVINHWFQYLPRSWQTLTYGSGILPNLKKKPLLYLQVPFFLTSMFFNLIWQCKKIKPDIIHAHWVIPQGFIAILVGKLLNIPVVTTAHGGDAFSLNSGLLSRLKRLTLRHSNAWTSNTPATAQAFGKTSLIPTPNIIPMGVDIKSFQNGSIENIGEHETRNIILFVGRLVEKKGVTYLIEAFSKLPKKTQQESVLWIIGEGDEQKTLDIEQRKKNIKSAFTLDKTLNGESIAIVDDVITTTATVSELARLLLKNGAGDVQVIALARTPINTQN